MKTVEVDEILYKLSVYEGRRDLAIKDKDQTFENIVALMIKCHSRFRAEYDRISEKFRGRTVEDTSELIFNFLKQHVRYNVESEKAQTIRTPAALIETGMSMGADCKNYALFIGGVMDALNRTGYNVPWCYRYASYDITDAIPAHVFVVLFPKTADEVWVDPVLPRWNQRKYPFYYQDRNMAVYILSGVNKRSRFGQVLGQLADDTSDGSFDFSSGAVDASSAAGGDISTDPSTTAVALTPTEAGSFDETAGGTYEAVNPSGTLLSSGDATDTGAAPTSLWSSVGSALSNLFGGSGSGSGISSAAGAASSLLNPTKSTTPATTSNTGTGTGTNIYLPASGSDNTVLIVGGIAVLGIVGVLLYMQHQNRN